MTIIISGANWDILNSQKLDYSPFGILTWVENPKRGTL